MKSWYRKEIQQQKPNLKSYIQRDEDVEEFLARLELLYDVPPSYLLPAEDMLKNEQICFFCMDEEWIRCMQQGALSIGMDGRSVDEGENVWHREAQQFFASCSLHRSANLRRRKLKLSERDGEASIRTGFLLRSEAVRCWPGIETVCWGGSDRNIRLEILRLEKIAGDILLCIADGEIKAVELSQPSEGIYMEARKENTPDIMFRKNGEGVLDIKAMADVFFEKKEIAPEEFGALFLHKQKRYIFAPDKQTEKK